MGGGGGGQPPGQTQQHQQHTQGDRAGLEESVHLVICLPPLVRLEILSDTKIKYVMANNVPGTGLPTSC